MSERMTSEQSMTIGEFAARSQLSPKALRGYEELGLLVPDRVDPDTGYRWYTADQLGRARLVALLRHLEMPRSRIIQALQLPGDRAAAAVRDYWTEREQAIATRRPVLAYVCGLLEGAQEPMETSYQIETRSVPERAVLSALRHVHLAEAGPVLGGLLGRMASSGPGLSGLLGCPYTVYHGAVTEDSDGPVELVRPMADLAQAERAAAALGDVQARTDRAHDELLIRLTLAEVGWPALLPVLDALEAQARALQRSPAGNARQVMIADWRTVAPDQIACELVLPLAPA
jgi:DNA-binding transcriptional MerR regulator